MGWLCTGCGERLGDSFETCWKCGHSRDGTPAAPDPEDDEESELPQLSPEALAHEREAIRQRAAEIKLEAERDGEYWLGGGRWSGRSITRLRRGLQLRRERQARFHLANGSARQGERLDQLWSLAFVVGVGSAAFWVLSFAVPPQVRTTMGSTPLWVVFIGGGAAFMLMDYLAGREIALAKRDGYADAPVRDF